LGFLPEDTDLEHPVFLDLEPAAQHLLDPGLYLLRDHPRHETDLAQINPEQHPSSIHS
jgi:hypothetical protein